MSAVLTMRRIVADRFEADHADFALIDWGE